MTCADITVPAARLAGAGGLFREIGDLKRMRVAHAPGSAAQRAFSRAWAKLVAGADPARTAAVECAAALAGTRLAGTDAGVLVACGLPAADVIEVLGRAVGQVGGVLHPAVVARAHRALPDLVDAAVEANVRGIGAGGRGGWRRGSAGRDAAVGVIPPFVEILCRQPRTETTVPDRPQLIAEPPENHGEHCWAVAVYGALLAEDLSADPGEAFLLGLAHHLGNTALPDAGCPGEILLGTHDDTITVRLPGPELATLPPILATRVRVLLELGADAATPVGQAFHAADVLDRVLQAHHRARAAGATVDQAMVDLEVGPAGPVRDYRNAVLAAAGLGHCAQRPDRLTHP